MKAVTIFCIIVVCILFNAASNALKTTVIENTLQAQNLDKVPYQIPHGKFWCNHAGAIHQDVPGCGRTCIDAFGNRGVMKMKNITHQTV